MKQRLGFKPMMSKGNFWICFDDFLREFEDVYVCRLFRTVQDKPSGPWYRAIRNAELRGQPVSCVPLLIGEVWRGEAGGRCVREELSRSVASLLTHC